MMFLVTAFAQENEQGRHYVGIHGGIQIARLQEKNNLRFYNGLSYIERAGGIQYRYTLHQENKMSLAVHTEFLGSIKGGYYEQENYGTVLFEQRFNQFNTGLTGALKGTDKGLNLCMGIGLRRNHLFFSSTQSAPVPDFNFKVKYPKLGYTSFSSYYGMEAYYDILYTTVGTYRSFIYFNFEQDISTDTFIFRSYYAGIGFSCMFHKRKTLKN